MQPAQKTRCCVLCRICSGNICAVSAAVFTRGDAEGFFEALDKVARLADVQFLRDFLDAHVGAFQHELHLGERLVLTVLRRSRTRRAVYREAHRAADPGRLERTAAALRLPCAVTPSTGGGRRNLAADLCFKGPVAGVRERTEQIL